MRPLATRERAARHPPSPGCRRFQLLGRPYGLEATVWKFWNFSASQILREIVFEDFRQKRPFLQLQRL